MKYLMLAALFVSGPALAQGTTNVDGHFRRDGTYVPPHVRTNPNSTKMDNWSTQGNTNPTTGQRGTVDPYKPTQSNPWGSPNNKKRSSSGW